MNNWAERKDVFLSKKLIVREFVADDRYSNDCKHGDDDDDNVDKYRDVDNGCGNDDERSTFSLYLLSYGWYWPISWQKDVDSLPSVSTSGEYILEIETAA